VWEKIIWDKVRGLKNLRGFDPLFAKKRTKDGKLD